MEALTNISRVQVLGLILLLIGLALRYWIKRRRFNRINEYGITQYKSYEHKVGLWYLEKPVITLGYLSILGGLLLLLVEWINKP